METKQKVEIRQVATCARSLTMEGERKKKLFNCTLSPIVAALLVFSLAGCANNTTTKKCSDNHRVVQSFVFGLYGENSDIEILNVYYGIPNCPANYDSVDTTFNGKPMQGMNTLAPMRRAHQLNVKWRIKSTGQEFEEKLDLRNKLPTDMTEHRVHFLIKTSQLYVYLAIPELLPQSMWLDGHPSKYPLRETIIFPDQSK